jgi:hypothetical protein
MTQHIDFNALPVTAETQAKLHGLALALAFALEKRDKSVAQILAEEWQRVCEVWERK